MTKKQKLRALENIFEFGNTLVGDYKGVPFYSNPLVPDGVIYMLNIEIKSKTIPVKSFKKGNIPWNKGLKIDRRSFPNMGHLRPHNQHSKELISQIKRVSTPKDAESHAWKGDEVGYRALHNWVERKLGKPMICSKCGDDTKKRYHWANISHKYLRVIEDWIRLCPKCHKNYDLGKAVLYH